MHFVIFNSHLDFDIFLQFGEQDNLKIKFDLKLKYNKKQVFERAQNGYGRPLQLRSPLKQVREQLHQMREVNLGQVHSFGQMIQGGQLNGAFLIVGIVLALLHSIVLRGQTASFLLSPR
ncbi:unnamed protein product [Paramecium octaurelia]|uniref:Uncharacterized protein n=1 Tax=Paramecium octaurelia TaxID=43137 RepID=A0A8S1X5I2_PAROT|nr:unnamed protein product [Paramecium octaurelia]CAD8196049.1 unnamed protein product [Paramecium octaurelia]